MLFLKDLRLCNKIIILKERGTAGLQPGGGGGGGLQPPLLTLTHRAGDTHLHIHSARPHQFHRYKRCCTCLVLLLCGCDLMQSLDFLAVMGILTHYICIRIQIRIQGCVINFERKIENDFREKLSSV